jgi:phosphoribosylanthranilate isomerase
MSARLFEPGEVRVKICGVTNREDALAAIEAGADALGFNFSSGSKRRLEPGEAADWIRVLPKEVTRVAVVVNPSIEELFAIIACGCFDAVQFHGDEGADDCATAGIPWIKAGRVRGAADYAALAAYPTPHLLLDGYSERGYGGTGVLSDWEQAAVFITANPDRKVILAGGLTPENVAMAVERTGAHAVDVASGVEVTGDARRKDREKVAEFIARAKQAGRG